MSLQDSQIESVAARFCMNQDFLGIKRAILFVALRIYKLLPAT